MAATLVIASFGCAYTSADLARMDPPRLRTTLEREFALGTPRAQVESRARELGLREVVVLNSLPDSSSYQVFLEDLIGGIHKWPAQRTLTLRFAATGRLSRMEVRSVDVHELSEPLEFVIE